MNGAFRNRSDTGAQHGGKFTEGAFVMQSTTATVSSSAPHGYMLLCRLRWFARRAKQFLRNAELSKSRRLIR